MDEHLLWSGKYELEVDDEEDINDVKYSGEEEATDIK